MKCPACKERTLREWIFRLCKEDERSTAAHFVTLTYNNHHLPRSPNGFKTLVRRDFTLFMKRLRRQTGIKPIYQGKGKDKRLIQPGIKYFATGEYGSKFKRPHYHAIIFNQPLKKAYGRAWAFYDKTIKAQNPIGETFIGSVTDSSIAYVCKYLDKPNTVGKFKNDDRVKEFRVMSQHLGDNFLTERMKQFYRKNLDKLYIVKDGYKYPMPKYYRDQIFTDLEKDQQLTYIVQAAMEKQVADQKYAEKIGKSYTQYVEERKAHIRSVFYRNTKPRGEG